MLLVLPLAAQKGARDGQWPAYSSESGSTGYSTADLVNRDNVQVERLLAEAEVKEDSSKLDHGD